MSIHLQGRARHKNTAVYIRILNIGSDILCAFCVLLISYASAGEPTNHDDIPGTTTRMVSEPQKIALSLRLYGSPENANVQVTLTNAGSMLMLVDRDLVFLLDVECMDPEGKKINYEYVRPLTPPQKNPKEWTKRFIVVKPGESVSRTMRLHKQFAMFFCAISDQHQIAAGESFKRVPQGRAIEYVNVTYGKSNYILGPAFKFYTGLSIDHLTQLRMPIRASISFSQSSKVTKSVPEGNEQGGGHEPIWNSSGTNSSGDSIPNSSNSSGK